jgi:hypothetical protein
LILAKLRTGIAIATIVLDAEWRGEDVWDGSSTRLRFRRIRDPPH